MTLRTNIPIHTIVGDDPSSVSFLSRTDNVPVIQTWLNGRTAGGTLKLINPCIKSHLDFSVLTQNLTIEVEGIMSMLINGGEIDLTPGITFKGVGGSNAGVLGDLRTKAAVYAYNSLGNPAADARLSGTTSRIDGPFYYVDFTGFPINTVTNGDVGGTLTINSGGDGSAVGAWTILGQSFDGPQNVGSNLNASIRAVWTGGGVPTTPQSGLNWSLSGGRSGSGVGIGATVIGKACKVTTNAFVGALTIVNAWKNWIHLTNTTQNQFHGLFRIIGTDATNHVYIASAIPFDSRYVAAATLPELGVGGTSGSPTVNYQIVSPMFRLEGGITSIQDLFLQAPGIGVALDGAKALTAPWLLENISVFSIQNQFCFPVVVDGAFEGYVRDCSFLPYTGAASFGDGYSIVLSQGTNIGGETGVMYLDHCTFTGGGVLINNQDGFLLGQGNMVFTNCLTENLLMAFMVWDPRGGLLAETTFNRMSLNDFQVSPTYLIDAVVRANQGDATIIRVLGGNRELANPPIGPNVSSPQHLEIRQQETFVNTNGYSLGTLNEYVLERGNRLDASLVGSAASFSPTIEFGHDITLPDPSTWGSLAGTATVTYPTIVGPDGHTNSEGNIIPVLSSGSGRQVRTLFDSGGGGFTPAVGDYLMVGGWVQTQNATQVLPSQAVVILGFINSMSFDNGTKSLFLNDDSGLRTTGAWRYITAIAKVITAPGGFNEFVINAAVTTSTAIAFKNLWVKYVPASANIPEDEIIRWYRQGSRSQIPNVAQGNLGIDPLHKLDWGGRATLGSPSSSTLQTNASTVQWATGTSTPSLKQTDNTTNSATGQNLTIQAQNATGTTAIGGNLNLTSGTGTSTNGNVNLQAGGTTQLAIKSTGLAGASAPVAWSSTPVSTTGGTTTLSSAQYQNPLIVLSGTLSSAATIVFPNVAGFWLVSVSGLNGVGLTNTLTFQSGSATSTAISSLTSTSQIFMVVTRGGNTIDINQ